MGSFSALLANMPSLPPRVAFTLTAGSELAAGVEAAVQGSALTDDEKVALRQAQAAGSLCASDLRLLKQHLATSDSPQGSSSRAEPGTADGVLLRQLHAGTARPIVASGASHSHPRAGEGAQSSAQLARGAATDAGGGASGGSESSGREAWREAMRARQSHREYQGLVTDLRAREIQQAKAGSFGLYKQQMSVGANLIVSLVSAVALGYFLGRSMYGAGSPAVWALAVACGIGMLLLEAFLVVTRLSRVDSFTHEAARRAAAEPPRMPPAVPAGTAARGSAHRGTDGSETTRKSGKGS
jgi:hypothetical protein